jgi:hypothetical protein
MRRWWIGCAIVAVLDGGCLFRSCGGVTPQPDACTPGSDAPVDGLQIGVGEEGPFLPYADGDVIHPVVGGQGATMILLRLRARGPLVPACMQQHTLVTDATGGVLARSDAALGSTADAVGRTTGLIYLPGDFSTVGAHATVTARAGGQVAIRMLVVGDLQDFPQPDLAPAADEAALDDAATD